MTHNSTAAELLVITQGFELTLNSKKEWLAYPPPGAIDFQERRSKEHKRRYPCSYCTTVHSLAAPTTGNLLTLASMNMFSQFCHHL